MNVNSEQAVYQLGALFGGVLHFGLMRNQSLLARAVQPAPLG